MAPVYTPFTQIEYTSNPSPTYSADLICRMALRLRFLLSHKQLTVTRSTVT